MVQSAGCWGDGAPDPGGARQREAAADFFAAATMVRSSDLLPDSGTLQAFEEERDLLRRPASTIGASPRYDWDAMYAWLTWFLFEKGVPDTQTALVSLVKDWFVQNSKSGEVPDESTIRKRLSSLWRRLRGEDAA